VTPPKSPAQANPEAFPSKILPTPRHPHLHSPHKPRPLQPKAQTFKRGYDCTPSDGKVAHTQ
jgi:hypothetical protein